MKLDWNVGLVAHLGIEFVEVGADRVVEVVDEVRSAGVDQLGLITERTQEKTRAPVYQ